MKWNVKLGLSPFVAVRVRCVVMAFLLVGMLAGCSPTLIRDPWDAGSQPRHYDVMMMTTDQAAARSFRTGCSAVVRGDYETAVDAFQAAIARDANFWEARFELARVYRAMMQYDLALEAFEQTQVLAPENDYVVSEYEKTKKEAVTVLLERAYDLAADQKTDEAELLFRRANELEPGNIDTLFALAEFHYSGGNALLAEHYSQEVLRKNPDHKGAGIIIARLYMKSNNTKEAGIFIDYFARRYPDDAEIKALKAALSGDQPVLEPVNDIFTIRQKAAITRGELCYLISSIVKPDASLGIPVPDPMDMLVVLDIADHWAYNAIHEILYYRIMRPFANHTFRPDEEISRGDLASAVYNTMRFRDAQPPSATQESIVINDISLYHVQHESIFFVVRKKLMSTDVGGNFNPNNRVSGLEAISVLEKVRN